MRGSSQRKKKRNKTNDPSINPYTGRSYSKQYKRICKQKQNLCALSEKDNFLKILSQNQIVILEGETGSGKTTQIPQFCLQGGYCKSGKIVGCTQPRRVAAMSTARRVAQEMDVQLGQEVGYKIRFENSSSSKTILMYMTDGMLLQEIMSDPLLSRYSVIILDEAHERSINTDLLMGIAKEITAQRKDLRFVVMSATIEVDKFRKYFNGAPCLSIPGRMYPVEVFYTDQPQNDYFESALRSVIQIHMCEPAGDILVFLTGEQEIVIAVDKINQLSATMGPEYGDILCLPLFSSLPVEQQELVFKPAPPAKKHGAKFNRKIIFATNIAETSLTIDGVSFVVDPGFSKQKLYEPRSRSESLLVSPIAQSNADQRAGRAGRTKPGKAFRLYKEETYDKELIPNAYPEILRSNLSSVVLRLKTLNVDVVHFDWMDPPAPETIMRALELLFFLGAVDNKANLTQKGMDMSSFPLDPQLSAALLVSPHYKCSHEILSLVALLSVPRIFQRPRGPKEGLADKAFEQFKDADGMHMTLLRAHKHPSRNSRNWCHNNFVNFRALKMADRVYKQLCGIFKRKGYKIIYHPFPHPKYSINIRKCLLAGFFMQVGRRKMGRYYYIISDKQRVKISDRGVFGGKQVRWFVYNELMYDEVMTKARTCSKIEGKWLLDVAPQFFTTQYFPDYESQAALEKDFNL